MTRQEASLFFRLVSYRYQRGGILITTNKGIRDWPGILAGDEVLATAILDALGVKQVRFSCVQRAQSISPQCSARGRHRSRGGGTRDHLMNCVGGCAAASQWREFSIDRSTPGAPNAQAPTGAPFAKGPKVPLLQLLAQSDLRDPSRRGHANCCLPRQRDGRKTT